MKNKHLFVRMGFAQQGLKTAIASEKSLRFQLMFAAATIFICLLLQPALFWWVIIIAMIALVLAAELFNTALELICDFIQPDHHPTIKKVKDISAGAVMMVSFAALVIGALFLWDQLF